ncbi:MAG: hypothetical protein WCK35_23860 [Chloroflexota bacterium]
MLEKRLSRAMIEELMPSGQEVQTELAKVISMDDFFGREGIFARLLGKIIEHMLKR